jgi:ABC-type transport system involved in multi-copper enzyme maturation permease subunit
MDNNFFNLCKYEAIKFFKFSKILIGFLAVLIFAFIAFPGYLGNPRISIEELQLNSLSNFIKTFFFVFSLGFACYIMGLEKEERTLKIIRSKPVAAWKVLTAKYLVGLIYTILQLICMFGVTLFFGLIFSNSQTQSLVHIFGVYSIHILPLFYIVALSILLGILTNSMVFIFLWDYLLIFASKLMENIQQIAMYLPTYNMDLLDKVTVPLLYNQIVMRKLSIMLIHIGILFVITVICYSKKEIRQ